MTSRHRLISAMLTMLMAFVLGGMMIPTRPAAAGDDPQPGAEEEQSANVDLVAFRASPDRLEITTGTTVTWTNKEATDYPGLSGRHTLEADDGSFASPSMAPGTRWSHRFTQPGNFTYHCTDHSGVTGVIAVTGPPIVEAVVQEVAITEDKPDDPTSWAFAPDDLVITTGSTVVWRNNGTNVHTVTSDDKLFDSGDIPPGGTWKYTFDQPGAFSYHCTPHPWMSAGIRVVTPGGTPPPPPVPPPAPASPPTPAASAGGSAPRGDESGPMRHDVNILEPDPRNPTGWTFDPPTLDVRAGDTVVWHNTGAMEHSVTADDGSFDSDLFGPGETWSRTFTVPAFVAYHCTPHPWMKSTVRVAALSGAPPPAPPAPAPTTARAVASAPPAAVRPGSGPATHPVNIVEPDPADAMGWAFNPATIEVRAGDTVIWRNTGGLQHTATGDAFDTGLLAPGATWSRRFETPGNYVYHCSPHPWMKGVVRVTDAAGVSTPEPPAQAEPVLAAPGEQAAAPPVRAAPRSPAGLTDLVRRQPGDRFGVAIILVEVGFFLVCAIAWCAPAKRRSGWTL